MAARARRLDAGGVDRRINPRNFSTGVEGGNLRIRGFRAALGEEDREEWRGKLGWENPQKKGFGGRFVGVVASRRGGECVVHTWKRRTPTSHCTCKSMTSAEEEASRGAQRTPETSGGGKEAWNTPGSSVEVPGSTPETTEMKQCTVAREWDVRPCLGTRWDPTTSTSDCTFDSSLFHLDRSMDVDLVHALYRKDAQAERMRSERCRTRSTNPSVERKSPCKEKTTQDSWESSHAETERTEAWTPRPRPGRTREACLQKKVDDLMEQLSLAKHKKQKAEEELAEQRREKKHAEKKMKVQYEDRLRECRREIHKLKLQLAKANERADTLELYSRPKIDSAAEAELEHFERRIQRQEKVILQLKHKESQLLKNAKIVEEALTNERQKSSKLLQNLEQDNEILRNRLRVFEERSGLESPTANTCSEAQNTRPVAYQNHALPIPILEGPEKKGRAPRGLEKSVSFPGSRRATAFQPLEGSAEVTSLHEEGSLRKQVAGLTHICNEQSALLEQMVMQLSRSQVSVPMQDSHLYHHLMKELGKIDLANPFKRPKQACTGSQHPSTKHTHQEANTHSHLVKEDSRLKDKLLLAHKRITELEAALSESKQDTNALGKVDPALPLRQRVLELELHLQTQEEAWREALATVRKSAAGEVRIIRAHAAAALRSRDQRLATLRGELEELLSIAHACLQPRVV